jgi:predicted secreted protein
MQAAMPPTPIVYSGISSVRRPTSVRNTAFYLEIPIASPVIGSGWKLQEQVGERERDRERESESERERERVSQEIPIASPVTGSVWKLQEQVGERERERERESESESEREREYLKRYL